MMTQKERFEGLCQQLLSDVEGDDFSSWIPSGWEQGGLRFTAGGLRIFTAITKIDGVRHTLAFIQQNPDKVGRDGKLTEGATLARLGKKVVQVTYQVGYARPSWLGRCVDGRYSAY